MSNKEIETEKNSEKETSGTKENSTAKNILGTIAYIAGVCIFVFLILCIFIAADFNFLFSL